MSNGLHTASHIIVRKGVMGSTLSRVATGPIGVAALVSTGAKYAGEYLGLPDEVNTVIGAPGDLLAKPLEAGVSGAITTVQNTFEKLSEGEVLEAGEELIGGAIDTLEEVVSAPFKVVGNLRDTLFE